MTQSAVDVLPSNHKQGGAQPGPTHLWQTLHFRRKCDRCLQRRWPNLHRGMFWLDTKQLDIKRKLLACPPARPHARLPPACPSACTLARPAAQLLLRSQTLATRWLARQLACPVASHLPVHLFGRPPACPHSCTIALMHACMPARPRAHPPDRTPTGSSAHTPAKHTAASAPARELVWQLACLLARSHARPPTGSPA